MGEKVAAVTQALQALYHQSDPTQREAAHQWLLSFQHSTDAWEVSFFLLSHQVCLFIYFLFNFLNLNIFHILNLFYLIQFSYFKQCF